MMPDDHAILQVVEQTFQSARFLPARARFITRDTMDSYCRSVAVDLQDGFKRVSDQNFIFAYGHRSDCDDPVHARIEPRSLTIQRHKPHIIDARIVAPCVLEIPQVASDKRKVPQRCFSHSKSPVNSIKRRIDLNPFFNRSRSYGPSNAGGISAPDVP